MRRRGGIVGLFDRQNKQRSDFLPPGHGRGGDDPVRELLSTYDPNATLGPNDAADLGAKLRALYDRRPIENNRLPSILRALENEAAMVRGRHYTEWVSTLGYLRGRGADDEALPLLVECIEAAERAARVSGMEPAPGYTERAAIIYRRRKDYAREIEVIERWMSRCPPRYGSERLEKRLTDAQRLRARSKAAG
jgi:hypothetical protein